MFKTSICELVKSVQTRRIIVDKFCHVCEAPMLELWDRGVKIWKRQSGRTGRAYYCNPCYEVKYGGVSLRKDNHVF